MQEETNSGAGPQGNPPERKKRQRFFNIYNVIGLILCILLLPGFIISSTLFFNSVMHSDVPPSCFGYTPLMVETGSMSPVFDENDLVIIHNTPSDATYKVGDIICFHSGDVYVTHRIKEIVEDEEGNIAFITQGDANNAPDSGSVSPDQVLGVYKTRFQGMGKAFLFIQSPVGMIVCVILPVILVLLLFLVPPLIEARRKTKRAAPTGEDR